MNRPRRLFSHSVFPKIISYYTKETGYEKEVENLIASCEKFGLPYEIEGIASRGSWEENCCYKPVYILEKLDRVQGPVLWLDADAVIVQKPVLFESLTSDIALRIVEEVEDSHPSKVISGTVFVNDTEKARVVLRRWSVECMRMLREKRGEVWDQVALRHALFSSDVDLTPLDYTYYAIYDKRRDEASDKRVVILHYQASRLLKKEVDRLVVPFWNREIPSQGDRRLFFERMREKAAKRDRGD